MKRIALLCLIQAGLHLGLSAQNPSAFYQLLPLAVNEKPVSQLIYGNFIELGFARQIEGLWSEKLYNASFEEVPPLKEHMYGWLGRSPDDDLSIEKWWHSGYEVNDWYVFPDNEMVRRGNNRYWNFHHGLQAAVLENSQPAARAFLAQDGIWISRGDKFLFRGYFSNNRTADPAVHPVEVSIGLFPEKQLGNPIIETKITVQDGVYREFSVELDPGTYGGRATFAISAGPGITVAVDGFSLMPLGSMKGWRKDVVETLKSIHVPMIRFPGGCFASFYDWREGVGPRLDRQPVESEYWGGIEENHAGTVEFIELCGMIRAEPFFCVNLLTGTADHAADWVEYCNGSQDSEMGALRKQHGYPDPFRVRYWELDNETYRRFGWQEYAKRCVEYSIAMKSVDPGIKLVMVGYWKFNDNLKEMLEIAGRHIDIITDRATSEDDLSRDLEIIREYNNQNGTSITLSNTEWLAPLDWSKSTADALNMQESPDKMTLQEHQISWNYAMNTARQLLLFQRLGGDFEFANFNNLANTWGQNIIECTKDTVFISAAGRVFELMSRSPLRWMLKTDTIKNLPGVYLQAGLAEDPISTEKIPNSKSQISNKTQNHKPQTTNIEPLTSNSERSGDSDESRDLTSNQQPVTSNQKPGTTNLIIYVLNYRPDTPEIRLDLKDLLFPAEKAEIHTLFADSPLSSNTYGSRFEVKSSSETIRIKNRKMPAFRLDPWSVTEIILYPEVRRAD